MTFLSPFLLAGLALVALPIVLHLVMRREPRRMEFPALRFIRQRHSTNQTRLKFRHWLLLLLRCLFVALLAMGLARPVLRGSGLLGNQQAGLATALVFDTSPRMEYRQRNVTRLEAAQQLANWLLEQFPAETEVAIVDPTSPRRSKLADRDAALLRTERLRLSAAGAPLAEAVAEGISLVNERTDFRREVYIFTDMTTATWDEAALAALQESLAAAPDVQLYLVDVGTAKPENLSLEELQLSSERLATGETLTLRVQLTRSGPASEATVPVELWLRRLDGELEKRGDQLASVANGSKPLEFTLAGLAPGVHQGYVQIAAADPLGVDNTRHFTVEVSTPAQVLLVAEQPEQALLLQEALAPAALAEVAAPRFATETFAASRLERATFGNYDTVMLVDPPPLSPEVWRKLADYVQSGGGVGLFLGRNQVGQLEAFNSPASQVLLPAPLKWVATTSTALQPTSYEHPILKGLSDLGPATPWGAFPVFKSWALGPLPAATTVVATYADGTPAILEHVFGSGKIVITTTPLAERSSDDPWNLLPTAPDPWPYLALAEGIADYLAGTDARPLNYPAGRTVALPLPRRSDLATYVLEPPLGDPLPQSLAPGQQDIVITTTDELGNYRVRSGGQASRLDRGFSTFAPGKIGDLSRVDFATIESALGRDRVELVVDRSTLTRSIDLGRVGRELYPWLMMAVALVLAFEQWFADRFYQERQT